MAHPLNRPPFDTAAETGTSSYTIIQPRISPGLPSATATPFSRLFTDPVGTDPYTKAVSDVYQDLAGEGSYIGKGIYDPRAFHRVLTGHFPDQTLLSHDLIEGAHLRVAFTSDIELFDDFPPDYLTYISREHRWIRGDWRIVDWCTPRVPAADGGRAPNPLSVLNRWKIFDNLRRSVIPAASVLFLVCLDAISDARGGGQHPDRSPDSSFPRLRSVFPGLRARAERERRRGVNWHIVQCVRSPRPRSCRTGPLCRSTRSFASPTGASSVGENSSNGPRLR